MRFKSNIAVITGANQGIAQGVAEKLASEGAHVICLDIKDCKETLHRITSAGGSAETAVMDVTQLSEWKHQVNKVLKDHGHIDILANIAGVVAQTADTAVELEEAEWDRVIGIDLKGVWLGMKTVIPSMIEKRYGRILNIASLAALRGLPNLFSYSAAKGGVTAIARLGTPRDVAHMAAYLTSPEAEFITGQTFPCDGGWSTK
jgi:NAD(P)-dependent dehydrogenase (short-subunit alcohol dehydrogenase family)